jgi:hypothetical protein
MDLCGQLLNEEYLFAEEGSMTASGGPTESYALGRKNKEKTRWLLLDGSDQLTTMLSGGRLCVRKSRVLAALA